MGITFKAFSECVGFVVDVRKPVLLRSRHGVGKSSCVYAYAEHLEMPVIERRASQMTEGDLLGLPKLEGGVTQWIPPAWLKEACDNPVLLFIDEIDRATPEVRQGFFELTDSRKIAGWELHPGTLIFAAVNGGEHGAQYQVGEMDPAELDRWTVFDLEPDVEDWLTWARDKDVINSMVCDFIGQNPNHLEHNEDFEPNKVYPSRRSWHRFSDCIRKGKLVEPGNSNPIVFNLANAFIGLEAAVSFQDFIRTFSKNVTAEDIVVKGNIKLTEEYDINDHSALIDKIQNYLKGNTKVSDSSMENLAKYFITLPSECAMALWEKVGNAEIDLAKKFHGCKGVSKHLVKIIKGEQEKK